MHENTPSADDGDAADESFEGAQIDPIASSASRAEAQRGPEGQRGAPGSTQRLSLQGKLARALVVALALLVALLVVLPHFARTVPPGIVRLLPPAPTATPQSGHFSVGQWEQVAGPPVQASGDLVASPVDPLTAYSCTLSLQADPSKPYSARPVTVWVTRDAGVRWAQAALPPLMGTYCVVYPARDSSHRVTLNVSDTALDGNAQACAHSQYFLSEDDGVTWRRLQHTSIAPPFSPFGSCTLWAVGRHVYLETNFLNNTDTLGRTILERSDDGGRSWTRADHGLEEVAASWYVWPLDATGATLGAVVDVGADLWITQDAGTRWQRTGSIAGVAVGTRLAVNLYTESRLGGGSKAYHCLFAFSYTVTGGASMGQLWTSHDATHWSPLPPLPVTDATAARSGVYTVLGMTVDGKLLVLGAEPSVGAVETPDPHGRLSGPPPRLWAWDTHVGRWDLAELRVPCQDLQSCGLYATGAAAVFGADGAPKGTEFWLTSAAQGGVSHPPQFYRLFIPAD